MPLDVFQQVYALSRAAGLAHSQQGTQSDLQQKLKFQLRDSVFPVIGNWSLAWGPVVWKDKPEESTSGPDLAWYIAFNPSFASARDPTYAIVLSGTPMGSMFTWGTNLNVVRIVDFEKWIGDGLVNLPQAVDTANGMDLERPYISLGTAETLHRVLHVVSYDEKKSLLDFVREVATSGSHRFVINGHSLGGALATSLALALATTKTIDAHRILTYPSAAPSPGTQGFVDRFSKTFPAQKATTEPGSYQVWNLNLVNELDIVPYVWCDDPSKCSTQNLDRLLELHPGWFVGGVVHLLKFHITSLTRKGVTYIPLPSQVFSTPSRVPVSDDFSDQAEVYRWQHMDAYHQKLGIDGLVPFAPAVAAERGDIALRESDYSDLKTIYEHPDDPEGATRSIEEAHAQGWDNTKEFRPI